MISGEGLCGFEWQRSNEPAVSMKQAQNVPADLLQNSNLPVRHIVAPGAMGEAVLVASNETQADEPENRQVEVKVLLNRGLAGNSEPSQE
jgi:outer membrane protein OmpA-like peptidoglycan-associated protein